MFLGASTYVTIPLASNWDLVFAPGVVVSASLEDGIVFSSSVHVQPTYSLLDTLALVTTPSTYLELSESLSETFSFDDAIELVARLLVSEGLAFTDDAAADISRWLLLAETLRVSIGVGTTLEIAKVLAEVLVLVDALNGGPVWARTLEETLTLADAFTVQIEALLTAQDVLALADEIRAGFVLITNESLELSDSLASTLEVLLRAKDTLAFIGRLPLRDGDYQAWVMNADTTGATSYSNFPMDSLFTYKGVPYGLTSTGLYQLEGDDDDGVAINSLVATGDINIGTMLQKNVPLAYLYVTQNGEVILRTTTSLQGRRTETYYQISDRATESDDDSTFRKVPLGKGVVGSWWQFQIESVDGASFDLSGAEIRYVALSRRGSWL